MTVLSILYWKENPIYVFSEKKLRGLSPNFHNSCICERFMYVTTIGPLVFLQQKRQTDRGNMYKSLTET